MRGDAAGHEEDASKSRSQRPPNCAAVSQQRFPALREKSSTDWAERTTA